MADLFDPPAHHGGPAIGGVHASDKGPGGIPVPALIVILAAGGYLAYEWWSNRSTTGSSSGTAGTSGTTSGAVGTGDSGEESFSYSGPGEYFYPGTGEPPYGSPPPSPSTNTQWERVVDDWLRSKGEQPGDVADTVSDYLDGQNLDRDERAMIDLAESVWGAPPQPIPVAPDRKRRKDRRGSGGGDVDEDGGISDVHGPRTGGSGPPVRRRPIRDKRTTAGDSSASGTRDSKDETSTTKTTTRKATPKRRR